MTEHKTSSSKQKSRVGVKKSHRYSTRASPVYFEAYNALGVILSKQGKYGEAEQAYRRAIEINPNYDFAYYNLGILLNEREKSEDVNNVDIDVLICASAAGYADVVMLLLEDEEADIHAADKKGRTALMWASIRGHEETVRLLLDKGADIHAGDIEGGTALTWASAKGHIETVRLLLDKEANIDATDNEDRTALIWASAGGHAEIVKLLLDRGANTDAADNEGRTALIWASAGGHAEIVKLLLNEGVNICATDGGNQNDSTDEAIEAFLIGYRVSYDQDIILDKIEGLDVDIAYLEQILDHIYPYVSGRHKELPKDKLARAKGKLKDALKEVASIPFPERKEIIKEHLVDLEQLKGEAAPPLPDPDLSGNTYPLYVKRTDPFKHLEEVWGPWLIRYTPSLKQNYLSQKQLRERDPVLYEALRNRLNRIQNEHIRDYISPYSREVTNT